MQQSEWFQRSPEQPKSEWLLYNSHRRQPMPANGEKVETKILVSGSARSGTRTMAETLRACGLRVVHEGLGSDGSVSCFYAVDDYWYQGMHWVRLSNLIPEHRWHQTRHPLKVINSIGHLMPGGFWHWQEKHTGVPGDIEPSILRAALFWLRWNEIIEAQNYDLRYQIEQLPERWDELAGRLGIQKEMPEIGPKGAFGGEREPTTWEMLEDADSRVAKAVRQKAKEYGYDE